MFKKNFFQLLMCSTVRMSPWSRRVYARCAGAFFFVRLYPEKFFEHRYTYAYSPAIAIENLVYEFLIRAGKI